MQKTPKTNKKVLMQMPCKKVSPLTYVKRVLVVFYYTSQKSVLAIDKCEKEAGE